MTVIRADKPSTEEPWSLTLAQNLDGIAALRPCPHVSGRIGLRSTFLL